MTLSFPQLVEIRKNVGNKKLKKPPKWLFPIGLERKYRRLLHKLVRETNTLINERLKPFIPEMLKEVEATYPTTHTKDSLGNTAKIRPDMFENGQKIDMTDLSCTRKDDFLDTLRGIIESIAESLKPSVQYTINEMELIGNEISDFNQNQFQKINRSVFGIDIFFDQPYLRDQLELFSRQNAQLITSLPEEELFQVSGTVERALVEGQRFTEVSKELQKRFGITRRRANLISRDQTTKLNASLTRLRQSSAGIEEYIWETAGDERVRPTHRAHDGKKFRWDDPPADTGHPGTDINCRCVAIPVLEGIIDQEV